MLEIRGIAEEVARLGRAYGYARLRRAERGATRATPSAWASPGDEMLSLRCRHVADGRGVLLEDRLIHLAAAPDVLVRLSPLLRPAPG